MVKKHEVTLREGHRGICPPFQVGELNFEDLRRESLHDGPHLSSTKSFFWLVLGKRNDIQ